MKYLVKVNTVDDEVSYQVLHITTAKHKPRGGKFIFLKSETKLNYPVVDTDENGKLFLKEDPAKEVEKLVTDEYQLMVEEIYTEMKNVFGTTNDVSASAFAATWEAMAKRPNKYIDPELGLTTKAEVEAYAFAKVEEADNYGKFRLKRIAKYKAKKAQILGG